MRYLKPSSTGQSVWPRIEAGFGHPRARRRWLAVAAAIVIAVAAGSVAIRISEHGTPSSSRAAGIGDRVVLGELVSASRELEELLDRPAMRSRVMNPRQAALVVTLEDRIAEVDLVLSASPEFVSEDEAVALWSHRVRLLAALVQLRGAPGSESGFRKAVLTEGSTT